MSDQFPAAVYAETVLARNFADAKKFFLDSLLQIHVAHTRMLARQHIITADEAERLVQAVFNLDRVRIEAAEYDGTSEDLFFFLESMLEEALGRDLAGKMHTARSRNDIAITLYRMTARRELLLFAAALASLRAALIDQASRHHETVMPVHTHTQPAQPTTLAHYLLAAIEFLERDSDRLQNAFARINLSPMGAAAITTSGFPIDRHQTARLLGFEGLAENSYGAIASIDYVTECAAALAVAMVNLGRLTQDLLLWCSREFGFVRLSEGFVQCSSIMPQKRNPVALEHTRILASRALGEAQAVLTCAHNTPFGDVNDSEDDLQPLVFTMFTDALRATRLLTGVVNAAEFDCTKLARRAACDFLTATELADTLVRREGLSFREAHTLVSAAVKACGSSDTCAAIASALKRTNPRLKMTEEEIRESLDPVHFVKIRNVVGGPAPERTKEAVSAARTTQQDIEAWIASKTLLLDAARSGLLK